MINQTSDKSVFNIDQTESFSGTNRRHFQRRVNSDRRATIRFELDREPRRSGVDRRAAKSIWDGRVTL